MIQAIAVLLLTAVASLGDARPSAGNRLRASADVDLSIIGGTDAAVGAWPWQVSLQKLSTTWSHSCGGTLLTSRYVLISATCVDGQSVSALRIVAGVHDLTDITGTQTTSLSSYKVHEQFNVGAASYSNDIAIVTLQILITLGGNIGLATLPSRDFDGTTCTITGWGRTSSNTTLPNILQQADINVVTHTQCSAALGSLATIWGYQLCVHDSSSQRGFCTGDHGGPLNCPTGAGGHEVAGVASWVIMESGNCQPSYPSVYTRTSTYLTWIGDNTP